MIGVGEHGTRHVVRVEQARRFVAVVNGKHKSAIQPPADLGDPIASFQSGFRLLAVREMNTLRCKILGNGAGRERRFGFLKTFHPLVSHKFLAATGPAASRDERARRPASSFEKMQPAGILAGISIEAWQRPGVRCGGQGELPVGRNERAIVRQQHSAAPGKTRAASVPQNPRRDRRAGQCPRRLPRDETARDSRVVPTFPRTAEPASGRKSDGHRRWCSSRRNAAIPAGCSSHVKDDKDIRACIPRKSWDRTGGCGSARRVASGVTRQPLQPPDLFAIDSKRAGKYLVRVRRTAQNK